MPLLVDCYNVLHVSMPPRLAGLTTAGLCLALAQSRWRRERITVVCDGDPGPLGLIESPADGVDLEYAGHSRKADDLIIERIDRDSAPRRLTVVSTDREIQAAARVRRARTLRSDEFVRMLNEDLTSPPPAPPPNAGKPSRRLDESEVQRWLDDFGIDADDAPEEPPWWRR